MFRNFRRLAGLVGMVGAIALSSSAMAQQTHWHGDYFPNVVLRDQNGRQLHFYDDVIRGKVVSINFIYTNCRDICPLDTAQLRRVQQLLGDRVGRVQRARQGKAGGPSVSRTART